MNSQGVEYKCTVQCRQTMTFRQGLRKLGRFHHVCTQIKFLPTLSLVLPGVTDCFLLLGLKKLTLSKKV